MAVKWELLEERSGLINRVIYLLATVESPQQFILMACCEFSNKWQESWLGKEHRILKNKKRLHISKRHSQGCSCYYNTMKHHTTKFVFVCCVISKIYFPLGPSSHFKVPYTETSLLHRSQNCSHRDEEVNSLQSQCTICPGRLSRVEQAAAAVGSRSWAASLGRAQAHSFGVLSVFLSLQDQATVMHHRWYTAWT